MRLWYLLQNIGKFTKKGKDSVDISSEDRERNKFARMLKRIIQTTYLVSLTNAVKSLIAGM